MNHAQKNTYAIVALVSVIFIDSLGFGLIFPILSPILMDPSSGILAPNVSSSVRDIDYGLVLGVFAVVMFFAAPVLGDLSDQIGRKKILLITLFGSGMSSLICAFAIGVKSIGLLLLGRIVAGLCAGSQTSAQAAMADVSSGKDRIKNLGLISAAGSAGFVFGPLIGGVFSDAKLVSWFSFSTPFYLDAMVAILNCALLMFSFEETYRASGKVVFNITKGLNIFIQAFKRPVIRLMSCILLLLELTFAFYIQFISLDLVTRYHFSSSRLGVFMSFSGLIFALTLGVLIRVIGKFFSDKQLIIMGLIISIAGYLIPLFFHTELFQWIALIPIIVGIGIAYNALLAGFSNSVSEHEQGWVMGVTGAVMAMAWILGAFCASFFFYFNALLLFIAATGFLLLALILAYGLKALR